MAIIKIKGRSEPIIKSYEIAKKLKQRWLGDDTVTPPIPKASENDKFDLGDVFSGRYGQISQIELNDKPEPILPKIKEPELTKEEREAGRAKLKEMMKNLNLLGKKFNINNQDESTTKN